jgi:hypothetical protein
VKSLIFPFYGKKIIKGLPKIRRHADDRAPTIDEIPQLCVYPDRRIYYYYLKATLIPS